MSRPIQRRAGGTSALILACGWLALALATTASSEEALREPVATSKFSRRAIQWYPKVPNDGLALTVSGQDVHTARQFEAGASPTFELVDDAGKPLPDGLYTYELRVVPKLGPAARKRLATARESGDEARMAKAARSVALPETTVQSGSFTVAKGSLVARDAKEEEPRAKGKSADGSSHEGNLTVTGDLRVKGTKNFASVDPGDPHRELYYAALEGPEAGTYYRGSARLRDGEAVIELPTHFAKLTESEGLTVQLTPLGAWSRLYVEQKSPERLVIRTTEDSGDIAFDFLVQGVRKGYADYEVERPAADEAAASERDDDV